MTFSVVIVTVVFGLFLLFLGALMDFPDWQSLSITLVASVLFILFQYLLGPEFVKFSTKLHYLKPGEQPWLEEVVKNFVDKSGLSMPRLAIVPDSTPNAFVFGRTRKGATLAVHEGLLKQLNKDEVDGVIAHELGHIKHNDFVVITVFSTLPLIAFLVARLSFHAAWYADDSGSDEDSFVSRILLLVSAAVSYVVYIVTLLFVMRLSRLREHYADAYSAYLTGSPRKLESALTKITYGLSISQRPTHGARTLYIGDPALAKQEFCGIVERKEKYDLDKDGVLDERELGLAMEHEVKNRWTTINTWFATHPATYQRILLLREIEKEMIGGSYDTDRIYDHV